MRLVSDRALAIMTIWQEARGEPWDGMIAVGNVIRHRMATRYQSDGTVVGTVCRRWQFSGWNWHDPNFLASLRLDDDDALVTKIEAAWDHSGERDVVPGAVHFLNVPVVLHQSAILPEWATSAHNRFMVDPALLVAEIGNHTFLRAKD